MNSIIEQNGMAAGDLSNQLTDLQQRLREAESQIDQLRKELSASENNGKQLEIEINRLKAQLQST